MYDDRGQDDDGEGAIVLANFGTSRTGDGEFCTRDGQAFGAEVQGFKPEQKTSRVRSVYLRFMCSQSKTRAVEIRPAELLEESVKTNIVLARSSRKYERFHRWVSMKTFGDTYGVLVLPSTMGRA